MNKSEVLELSKAKAKEIFKKYKKSGGLDILDEEIEVIGLKEYENKFRCIIICKDVKNIHCEFIYMKRSNRLTHTMYKKIDI